jgi:hypothetical protein
MRSTPGVAFAAEFIAEDAGIAFAVGEVEGVERCVERALEFVSVACADCH